MLQHTSHPQGAFAGVAADAQGQGDQPHVPLREGRLDDLLPGPAHRRVPGTSAYAGEILDFLKTRMPKVRVRKPEGTYILWMDFRDYGLSAQEIHKRIYVDANVMLEGGPQFDPERGAGFERMCLCTRRSLLKEALERIAAQFPEP